MTCLEELRYLKENMTFKKGLFRCLMCHVSYRLRYGMYNHIRVKHGLPENIYSKVQARLTEVKNIRDKIIFKLR